jgi:hypothetical protein
MGKKAVKVDHALKAKLEAEAAEREAKKAEKAAEGVPEVKHKTAAEIRASAERKEREQNEAKAKAKRNEDKAVVLSDEARAAAEAASEAAAHAAAAAASAARAAASARIAREEADSRAALRRHSRSAKFHKNNPTYGKVQELSERELASMAKKRGGRRTRRNRK